MTEHIVQLKGLPFKASIQEITDFLDLQKDEEFESINLIKRSDGKLTGEAYVICLDEKSKEKALEKNKMTMKGYQRPIEVYASSMEMVQNRVESNGHRNYANGNANSGSNFQGNNHHTASAKDVWDGIIRMRGLPYESTLKDVEQFFTGIPFMEGGISFPLNAKGNSTGQAYIQFETYTAANEGLMRNKQSIGGRYIELFKSCNDELRKALIDEALLATRGPNGMYSNNNYNGTEPYTGEGTVMYGGLCLEADNDGKPVGWSEVSLAKQLQPMGYTNLPGHQNMINSGAGQQPGPQGSAHVVAGGGPHRAQPNQLNSSTSNEARSNPYPQPRPNKQNNGPSPFPHVIAMHGLRQKTDSKMIQNFFTPLKAIAINNHGTGLCEVAFKTHGECVEAMKKDNKECNGGFIRLELKSSAPIKTENSWYH